MTENVLWKQHLEMFADEKKFLGNVMVNNLKITTRGDVGRVQDDVQMNLSRISKVFIF